MATRLYPGNTVAPISPAFDAGWEATGDAVRRRATRDTSKYASDNTIFGSINSPSTVGNDALVCQLVYGPLAPQTISGTLKGQMGAREAGAGADSRAQVTARVVSAAGALRGTLLGFDAGALSSEFFVDSADRQNRKFPRGGAQALTSVDAQDGDYVIVEYGFRTHSTGTQVVVVRASADSSATTDLPEDETTSVTEVGIYRGWFEFSANLKLSPGALSGTITPTGALTKKVKTAFAGALAPITGALTALRKVFLSVAGSLTPAGTVSNAIVAPPPVLINGADHSDYIDFETAAIEKSAESHTSLFKFRHVDESLNIGLTLAPLKERDEVVVFDGSTRVFGGQISNITPRLDGLTVIREVACQSFACLLDQVVIESDIRTGARYDDDEVEYLITTYGAALGLTAGANVTRTRTLTLDEIDYSGLTLRQALAELANHCVVTSWVDDDKDVHWTNPAAAQLVQTGTFSAAGVASSTGWNLNAAATVTADAGPGGSGDFALATVGPGAGEGLSNQQITAVVAGARYVFSLDMKGADAQYVLRWLDAGAGILRDDRVRATSEEWETYSAIYTAPATATNARIYLGGVNNFASEVRHDNVSLIRETAPFGVSTSPDGVVTQPMENWSRPTEASEPVNRLLVRGDGISGWREHAASIAYYGGQRFEGALDDKRVTTSAGIDTRAEWFFASHAFPRYTGTFDVREPGLEPGDYQIIEVEPLGLASIEFIVGMTIRYDGDEGMIYTVTYGQPANDLGRVLGDITQREMGVGEIESANIKANAIKTIHFEASATIKLVTNDGSTVVINEDGIAITDGSISVENGSGTVIIDGTSDMFKIVGTGTINLSAPNNNSDVVTTSLPGLGSWSYMPAHLMLIGGSSNLQINGGFHIWDWGVGTGGPLDVYGFTMAHLNKAGTTLRVDCDLENWGTGGVGGDSVRYYVLLEAGI